jgi:hypothetical protein
MTSTDTPTELGLSTTRSFTSNFTGVSPKFSPQISIRHILSSLSTSNLETLTENVAHMALQHLLLFSWKYA